MGLGKTRSPGRHEREEGDEVDRVKGKIAIVTGGAKGIGRSACSLLAREGAVVALTDVLNESGRQAVDEIAKAGGGAHF